MPLDDDDVRSRRWDIDDDDRSRRWDMIRAKVALHPHIGMRACWTAA
jgi:hypothetical protein